MADLARASLAYDAPNASMEVVKAFTSRCMEDENATAMYDAALLEFEGHFDDVFEDLNGWMFGGPNGTVLPLGRMCNALKQVDVVLMALQQPRPALVSILLVLVRCRWADEADEKPSNTSSIMM